MHNKLLFPYHLKKIGWFLLATAVIFQILIGVTGYEANWLNIKVFALLDPDYLQPDRSLSFISHNIAEELIGLIFILGGLLAGFSREKNEDEFISGLRLSSLLWAVLVNYILLALALVLLYGSSFFSFMIWNMFTVLIIFLGRFNYVLYRTSKVNRHEKQY